MKIGIAAGHSDHPDNDGHRQYEFNCCETVEHSIALLLKDSAIDVCQPMNGPGDIYAMPNDEALNEKVKYFNAAKVDLAIELHLDRFPGGVGDHSMAIHWPGNTYHLGYQAAKYISAQLDNTFPWDTRGAVDTLTLGRNLAFLGSTKMPAVIVEAGFMDNPKHRAVMDTPAFPVLYAVAVFQGIMRWIGIEA